MSIMVTRPMYKKKEVSAPPYKMKHISPLRRLVFLPLTCIILKRNHITISPPFCHDWQMVQETRKLDPRNIKMIKDDQGGTRNPYKCINVMKQDVMDDKIIERWKTWEKNACKRISTNREAVEQLSSRSQSRWIENLSARQKVSRWIKRLSRSYRDKV